MSEEFIFINGNENHINDILLLLDEILQFHKEINTDINLSTNYLSIYRKSITIELKDPKSCLYLLVYKDKKPIAFGVGKKIYSPMMFNEPCKGYIPYIYIKPYFRRKGLGRKIIIKLENWFKKNNLTTIEINVMEENEKAMKFYNELGFLTISKRLRKQMGD